MAFELLLQQLRKVVRPEGPTDGHLLGRFLAGEGGAFEALVLRHGPMVYGVCRRLLGNTHDAEDAFQAAFLVLARKAPSVTPREAIGNWLFGVARRTALEARARNARRRAREQQVEAMPDPAVAPEEPTRDLREALDGELHRLPDKYRLPVILCELEGRGRKEVARQLGLAEGTLSSRLATARKMLAKRMARFSSVAIAAALGQSALAGVPPVLVTSTVKAAGGAGSTAAVALAQGVMKAMFLTKLRTASWAVGLALAVNVGAVGLTFRAVNAQPPAAQPAQNDLEALRLEIEALRKALQATRERVAALEVQAGG
jgi:RNA polymerase sigma factor (sigma-70 family)